MSLAEDVQAHVERIYGTRAPEISRRLELLADHVGEIGPRVQRCILHLAAGDVELVEHYVRSAETDWRDVIYWAEYDEDDRRLRDFNAPIEDGAG